MTFVGKKKQSLVFLDNIQFEIKLIFRVILEKQGFFAIIRHSVARGTFILGQISLRFNETLSL